MKLDALHSWYKFIDVQYISDELMERLSLLDINNDRDQEKIIKEAFIPEYLKLSERDRNALRSILEYVESFNIKHILRLQQAVETPFPSPLADPKAFFVRLANLLPRD